MEQIVSVYASPDKNGLMVATEKLTKRALSVVKELLPALRMHMLRAEGVICVSWKPLLRVAPHEDGSYDVFFNPRMLATSRLNKEEFLENLEDASTGGGGGAGDVEWVR